MPCNFIEHTSYWIKTLRYCYNMTFYIDILNNKIAIWDQIYYTVWIVTLCSVIVGQISFLSKIYRVTARHFWKRITKQKKHFKKREQLCMGSAKNSNIMNYRFVRINRSGRLVLRVSHVVCWSCDSIKAKQDSLSECSIKHLTLFIWTFKDLSGFHSSNGPVEEITAD